MANGAFKFKDSYGNILSFISGSGSNIIISGGTLDLSGMTGLTLGNVTLSGTTQNAISASHAASYLLTSSFNTYSGNTNTIIGSLQTTTGSLNSFTSSATNRLNSIEGVTGSYATTGSNTFNGNLTVNGYVDVQELRTTFISSSILYRSGSTKFGDELTDTHAFTGSLLVSGSISSTSSISGNNFITNGTTLYGITLKGRSADNYGAIGFYSSDGLTRYGYVQSHSTNGGQLNITSDGGGQVIMDNRGVVVTSALSGSAAIFSGNLSIQSTNTNRMLNLGASNGAHGYIALYGPSINEGNIYHTSTYGIYMDTNTNLLPIRIDGSKLVIGVTGDVIAGSTGTPEGKIDIKGGALVVDVSNNGYGGFKLDDDSNGDYNVNFRAGRGGTNDGFRWYLNARPGGGGAFSTGNERMRLTNTGLGVGVDNPLGKLHIRSSGISASAPSNGWPIYNAEADTNARRIYIDTAGNDNVGTAGHGATAAIELCGYFDSRAVITTQAAGSTSPSDQGTGRGKDLMIKAGSSDNTNGYKGGRLYLNGGIGFQGGFGANGGDILMQVLGGSGNVGINQTQPQSKLDVNGNIKNGGRVYSGNSVIGNISTNLDASLTRNYILICDLNDIAGFSLNGFMNAASYTCWNMSSFYIMKNYSSTTASAGITGQYKGGGCDMNIVDLSYGGGRYIAIGYTSNPEIDVVWTGYRLLHMLNADGSAQVVRQAYVTVNSTLATY